MDRKTFQATTEELAALLAWVESYSEAYLPHSQLMRLMLVTEEACVNVINYAYKNSANGNYVSLEAAVNDEQLIWTIADAGHPFDPLHPKMKRETNLESAEAGGYGRIFMLKFADAISYRYENGENILTIAMNRK